MNSPCNEFPKTQEGVREDRWGVGVVGGGGRSSGPISQEVLFCPHLEPLVGGNDQGDRREVVCQVKGDGGG